jgi:hypothetical protein
MILGPMLISLLSGLAAAVGWVLTGGSIWVAISIVYGLAATAGLLVSASLMALRSPAASDRLAAPRHGYHPPPVRLPDASAGSSRTCARPAQQSRCESTPGLHVPLATGVSSRQSHSLLPSRSTARRSGTSHTSRPLPEPLLLRGREGGGRAGGEPFLKHFAH